MAGATKTTALGLASLTDVEWTMSGLVVLMSLVGGLGTLVGPIVGAVLVIGLENRLGDIGEALAWFGKRAVSKAAWRISLAFAVSCLSAGLGIAHFINDKYEPDR